MPVKPLRRIGLPANDTLYDRMSALLLNSVDSRANMAALERERTLLVLRSGENTLTAAPRGSTAQLLYGYENERAFVEQFPSMFERLLPKIRKNLQSDRVRVRLSYNPARPVIEPVLKNLWFNPTRNWLSFSLARPSKLPAAPTVTGVKFRNAAPSDLLELLRLDAESFPNSTLDPAYIESMISGEQVVVATARPDVAGFCVFSQFEPEIGYVNTVAVTPNHRDRGIGAALTMRAARALFVAGSERVDLTTDETNSPAIRLYVRLGFRQDRAGRDYSRPTDPRAIEKLKAEAQGTFIKFGGWR
ncbi:MAG TPA: GNAT family N-acetyltransferase [Dehalococcoidia bacterium]|jgi:ribosomal protein S18 acetylase RimI-like enzyme